ncbi:TPA: hypothetical protein ACH3X3_012060 [Trebouxia sp. C0006]
MAFRGLLHGMLALATLILGSSSAARVIPSVARRSLLQVIDINSCGGRTYITEEEVCITVGSEQWLCPVAAPCSCPTDHGGLNPFTCYDPSEYYCRDDAPDWPVSGLLPGWVDGLGISNAGTCEVAAPAPGPVLGPASAPTGLDPSNRRM